MDTGQRFADRYDLIRPLGAGGMGLVFLARDVHLDRDVAVKMLPPELAADAVSRERLRREARAAAALDHPFVCKVFEVIERDQHLGIVMELVIGETLHARLARGPVPLDDAVAMAGEIAEALEAAHDLRLVHRDLKPANVMVTTRGHLKVMDFGLAKTLEADAGSETRLGDAGAAPLTDRSARVGTPAYMAPEQIAGDAVDHRSDIFAFGVLLTELVTGVHPFNRPTLAGTIAAVLKDPPIVGHASAPGVPSGLRAVLHRMLAKAPAERYQSMREVRDDLRGLRAGGSTSGSRLEAATSGDYSGRTPRWPMVGRDAERAELTDRLEAALSGRGSLTVVGGEPGIGKTRLTEDLLEEARRRGCFCLVGHCYEGEGAPPYVPFIEITERTARVVPPAVLRSVLGDAAPEVAKLMPELRHLFDDIPPPLELPAEQQRRFFFNAYRDFVERACRANPIAVVFEDLHWADEPALQLLMHLAQAIPALPMLVIGTYRDVELDVNRPFARVLETLLRQRQASRIALRRLPSDGVANLLSAMSGRPAPPSFARAIHRETEGNPFFVEEVFQHLSEEGQLFDDAGEWRADLRVDTLDVPEGVRLVIGRRLERLTDATRRILTTAAVIGRTFSLALLEALEASADGAAEDATLEAIEAAERAHLLSSQTSARDTRCVFAHELIRQTLAESLSLPRRQRLHARIAAAIERVYAASLDAHVSALAHHLYQAGAASDPVKATDCLIRAAGQARAAAAHEDALTHLDNALSIWEGETSERTADLLERRGSALRSLGRSAEAIDAFGHAADAWAACGAADRAADPIIQRALVRLWLMDIDTAILEFTRALDALTDLSRASRSALLYHKALMQASVGDTEEGAARLADADALREPGADAALDLTALAVRAVVEWTMMHASASAGLAREVAAVHAARGEAWQEVDATWSIPWSLFFLGRPGEAEKALAEFESKAARVGHQGALWVVTHSRAVLEAARGDMAAAERTALEARDLGRVYHVPWVYHTDHFLSTLAIWQGRTEEGLAGLRAISEIETDRNYWFPTVRAGLFAALASVDPAAALAMHDSGPVVLRFQGALSPAGTWSALVHTADGLARLGLRDDILALAPMADALAASERVFPGGWTMPGTTAAGIVCRWAEDWDRAEAYFRQAIQAADSAPARHLQGRPREWYADMLLARDRAGDRETARRLLEEAGAIHASLHLSWLEGLVHERLLQMA